MRRNLKRQIRIWYREHKALNIALAVAIIMTIGFIGYLRWRTVVNPEAGSVATHYAAPLAAGILGNPKIEDVPVGSKPIGFPADLPLYESKKIVQAYRLTQPNAPGFHAIIAFESGAATADIVSYYEQWFGERAWSAQLQPAKNPRAVYAVEGTRSITVATVPDGARTIVTISYDEK